MPFTFLRNAAPRATRSESEEMALAVADMTELTNALSRRGVHEATTSQAMRWLRADRRRARVRSTVRHLVDRVGCLLAGT